MNGKFVKQLQQYDYILGIDLASYKTGICLYDIRQRNFVDFFVVQVQKGSDHVFYDLYKELTHALATLSEKYGSNILAIKERCPQQNGAFTTASTLQSLAGAHAVLEVCLCENPNFVSYDKDGVHTTSVKALFKTSECQKPTKADIRKTLVELYHLDDSRLTDDISDAMGVVHTLLIRKWNADLDTRVKEIKKEIKTLKQTKVIEDRQHEIERLNSLKI